MPEGAGPGAVQVEASGETIGEAKWAALRQLESLVPGLDKSRVRFQVLSEGERGLLGVGQVPARVLAEAASGPAAAPPAPPGEPEEEPGTPEATVRRLLELVCAALGVRASVSVRESDGQLLTRLSGPDVGLVIGKRGHTIDAIQTIAGAVARSGGEERPVVVDAAGYRSRRQASLERVAEDAARETLATGAPVRLEPMSAPERKLVHVALQERADVTTSSEGTEPNRCVVVAPAPTEPPAE